MHSKFAGQRGKRHEETGSCYEMVSPKKCLETSWTEKSNRNMMEKNRKRIKRLQPRSGNQKHQGWRVQFNCAQGATVWWPRPGTIVPKWWKKLGLCAAPSVMEHCQTVGFSPRTNCWLAFENHHHTLNEHKPYQIYEISWHGSKKIQKTMFMDSMDSPSIGAWQELLKHMWNASMMSTQCTAKNLNNLLCLWSKWASTYMQKRHQQWQMFRVTCSKWRCQCLHGLATNHLDTTWLVPMIFRFGTTYQHIQNIRQWHQSKCIFNWNQGHWLELKHARSTMRKSSEVINVTYVNGPSQSTGDDIEYGIKN